MLIKVVQTLVYLYFNNENCKSYFTLYIYKCE